MGKFFNSVISFFVSFVLAMSATVQGFFGYANVRVDFDDVIGDIKPVNSVGKMPYGNINSPKTEELNTVVAQYMRQANIKYNRNHDVGGCEIYDIFPDFSRDPNDESAYDFSVSDTVVRDALDYGMETFFRLGISYSYTFRGEKDIKYMTPPEDFEKFAEVCAHIVMHYNYGWNNGYNYNIEYWEIWNEPEPDNRNYEGNHFWLGTSEQFFEMFDLTAKTLKNRFPEIKVGGYASCGFQGLNKKLKPESNDPRLIDFIEYFDEFLCYIKQHETPLDFFSWHSYVSVEKNERSMKYVRMKLDEAGYEDTVQIVDEWNVGPLENDKIDMHYCARQVAMLTALQNGGVEMAHYYCISPLYGQYSGLFSKDSKPTGAYWGFYAFGQLLEMGEQVKISGASPKDFYSVAAGDGEKGGLLIVNASENLPRFLNIKAKGYSIDKCYTINDNMEWTETDIPRILKPDTVLYVTFNK